MYPIIAWFNGLEGRDQLFLDMGEILQIVLAGQVVSSAGEEQTSRGHFRLDQLALVLSYSQLCLERGPGCLDFRRIVVL